ncbi:C6 finger domain protein [Talaromyces proteolyticus]|uniref:C6 finger domain protein n=1 Tax=Talaromyces proteolyticus TaxID=1131652 RepID=A0AAD4KUN1_9EURO|nr:C6 finger domain protein [Talaromyces proteolyticus]KAH8698739.1 C6 finger domain protein [Talaromyces proteolyticus]
MSASHHRSYAGCWTCKKAKRKCDSRRPACQSCQKRGVECEGYDLRLRWGSGIASRGRFTGADKPLLGSGPPRPKGRRRDLSRERKRAAQLREPEDGRNISETNAGATVDRLSPSAQMTGYWDFPWLAPHECHMTAPSKLRWEGSRKDQLLFKEFLTTGINLLHAATIDDIPLVPAIPQLCMESEALYPICLAIQCHVSPNLESEFLEYFNVALSKFRSELARSSMILGDANLAAGLLLCTIGLMRGTPWTVHLEGMYHILQYQDFQLTESCNIKLRMHLIEVMGVMDLRILVVGRQTPCFGVWRRHRQSLVSHDSGGGNEVEPVSGLPRSLLDLYAGIGEDTTEIDLWNWPGEKGSLSQCHLWEAHRLAGMLNVRRFGRRSEIPIKFPPGYQPPDNEILVRRILSCIEAITKTYAAPDRNGSLVVNALTYPIFTAALELEVLRNNSELKNLIRHFLRIQKKYDVGVVTTVLQGLLEDLWNIDEVDIDVDDLARSRGIETGLF